MAEAECDLDVLNNNSEVRKFPYEINKVDDELNRKLLADFTGEKTGFLQIGPKKWFFPSKFENEAENYYNFQVREDDVWIVTFPRSGTTWTQEMVWLIANDLNYEKAAEVPLTARFPFLEFSVFVHEDTKSEFLKENEGNEANCALIEEISQPAWKLLQKQQTRRFIKTHLPFSLLPPKLLESKCKVIYVARNPKDVSVSFYHLNRLIRTQGYQGDFDTYWNYFQNNLQPWTPYWSHIEEAWQRRDENNLLFLFYEDLNEDLRSGINKIAKFLEKDLSEKDIERLEDHLRIENFRRNESVNYDILKNLGILVEGEQGFVRNGRSKGWKGYFSEELKNKADAWIEENLKKIGIKFPEVNT